MHPFHRFAQLPDLRRFGHLRLLLFWPLFSLTFYALEHLRPPVYYHPMRCALDAMIPFCRWFVIPYVFWFLFVAGCSRFPADDEIHYPDIFLRPADILAFSQLSAFKACSLRQ